MNSTSPVPSRWVCQSLRSFFARGYFLGDNPIYHSTSILYAQLTISALLSAFLQFILTPLGVSAFVSMMLVGFVLGPSAWGENNKTIDLLYPLKSYYVNETFACFGIILFMFVVGAKMDMTMVKTSGKKAVLVGILNFLVPLTLNLFMARILSGKMKMEIQLHDSVYYIAAFQSVSSFQAIASLLADLKLLNSELGRLATSSSMISGICSWITIIVILTRRKSLLGSPNSLLWMFVSAVVMVILIIYFMRPIMVWMVGNTSEGKAINEGYIISIFVMLSGCIFISEAIGQHFIMGALIFGMAVPDGPPLGSALVNKIESFVSGILLPSYFVFSVSGVNIFSVHSRTVIVVSVLGITSFIGKVLAAMLPALYCKMPPVDAFSFGLIMSTQGIADVMLLQHGRLVFVLNQQTYSIMVVVMVLLSGTLTPIIKVLYKPSTRFQSLKKRTIQHASPNVELRMMACVYDPDYTPSILSLVEVTNPTTKSPMCCYVVHLIELSGRSSPLLIHHRSGTRKPFHGEYSSHIINAFRFYEQHSKGRFMVNLFTAISPFSTIHEEVCRLAFDKRTSMIIIPFHKHWAFHGIEEFNKTRAVNLQILSKAPCSVGIFVDRGTMVSSMPKDNCPYNVGIIFVHGKDDREALAYAMRMAGHPNVSVSMVHVKEPTRTSKNYYSLDMDLDNEIISEFKIATIGKRRHFYREEIAEDSVELVSVIRNLENAYDLVLVGRHHNSKSPLFFGLTEWNEFPELGLIGDTLVSSGSFRNVSVLVVQQQLFGDDDRVDRIDGLSDPSGATTETAQALNC